MKVWNKKQMTQCFATNVFLFHQVIIIVLIWLGNLTLRDFENKTYKLHQKRTKGVQFDTLRQLNQCSSCKHIQNTKYKAKVSALHETKCTGTWKRNFVTFKQKSVVLNIFLSLKLFCANTYNLLPFFLKVADIIITVTIDK